MNFPERLAGPFVQMHVGDSTGLFGLEEFQQDIDGSDHAAEASDSAAGGNGISGNGGSALAAEKGGGTEENQGQ